MSKVSKSNFITAGLTFLVAAVLFPFVWISAAFVIALIDGFMNNISSYFDFLIGYMGLLLFTSPALIGAYFCGGYLGERLLEEEPASRTQILSIGIAVPIGSIICEMSVLLLIQGVFYYDEYFFQGMISLISIAAVLSLFAAPFGIGAAYYLNSLRKKRLKIDEASSSS